MIFGKHSELDIKLKESEKLRFLNRLHRFLVIGILLLMLVRVYQALPTAIAGVNVESVEVSMQGLIGVVTMFIGEVLGVASSTLIIIKVILQHLMMLLGLFLVHIIVHGHVRRKEKKRIKRELLE